MRIKPIGFLPGSLEPNPDGRRQLEKLINFLRNKPKVELQVLGRATPHEVKALRKRQSRGKAVTMQMLHKLAEDRSRLIERILVRRGVKPKRLFILTGDRRSVTDAAPGRVEFDLLH